MEISPFLIGNTSSKGPFLHCYVRLPECSFDLFSREHSELDFWWQVSTHKNDQKEIAKILSNNKNKSRDSSCSKWGRHLLHFSQSRKTSKLILLPLATPASYSPPFRASCRPCIYPQNCSKHICFFKKNQASLALVGQQKQRINPSQNSGNPSEARVK